MTPPASNSVGSYPPQSRSPKPPPLRWILRWVLPLLFLLFLLWNPLDVPREGKKSSRYRSRLPRKRFGFGGGLPDTFVSSIMRDREGKGWTWVWSLLLLSSGCCERGIHLKMLSFGLGILWFRDCWSRFLWFLFCHHVQGSILWRKGLSFSHTLSTFNYCVFVEFQL